MGPVSRDEEIQRSWEANAEAWNTAVREQRLPSRIVTSPAIMDVILARKPARVLDVGCGEGWLVRALTERGVDAHGVDGSEELVERAHWAGHGHFRVATYQDLIAQDIPVGEPFDVVVCNFSLFDRDLTPLFRSLRRRLPAEPGAGALIVQTLHPFTALAGEPYQSGWRVETFANVGGDFSESMPWYARTLEDWWILMHSAGFAITEVREPRSPDGDLLSMILVATPVTRA